MRNNVLYPIFGVLCNGKSFIINYCDLRLLKRNYMKKKIKISTRNNNI